MEKLPKILLAAPISDYKDYCLDEWMDHVNRYNYPLDYFFVDNSNNESYYEKFPFTVHIEPKGSVADFIAMSQRIIRKFFLYSDYDYLFMNECDVFGTPNVVADLLAHDVDVVTASYFTNGKDNKPLICWSEMEGNGVHATQRLLNWEESFLKTKGKLQKVFACGIGCTLIKRHVIEQIDFRSTFKRNESGSASTFSDSMFYTDCHNLGINAYLDTSILVDHRYSSWDSIPELNISI